MPYTSLGYLYALGWYQIKQTLEAHIYPTPHSLHQVCKERNAICGIKCIKTKPAQIKPKSKMPGCFQCEVMQNLMFVAQSLTPLHTPLIIASADPLQILLNKTLS